MAYALVLYHSVNGGTRNLAYKLAQGIEKAGLEARVRQVPPVRAIHDDQTSDAHNESSDPWVNTDDVKHCLALAVGSPVRFGNMAAALKYFWDSTSTQWLAGELVGRPACVFTSGASLHGGQESTLLSMMLPLLHHGMLVLGTPFTEPELHRTTTGGSPYGASHVAGMPDSPELSDSEITLCMAQGERLAATALALSKE